MNQRQQALDHLVVGQRRRIQSHCKGIWCELLLWPIPLIEDSSVVIDLCHALGRFIKRHTQPVGHVLESMLHWRNKTYVNPAVHSGRQVYAASTDNHRMASQCERADRLSHTRIHCEFIYRTAVL